MDKDSVAKYRDHQKKVWNTEETKTTTTKYSGQDLSEENSPLETSEIYQQSISGVCIW